MTAGLQHRVARSVVARRLWEPGARVAVAVSGGRDSVALLDLLHASRGVHGGRLSVVTVDHGTRQDGALDADHVVELAAARGLACQRATLTLGPHASEAEARAARYAVFDELDVEVVALGHHADDQAETALLGLLRGGGTRALAGMSWRRGRYVRPLLDISHADLDAWARHRGLSWREDPTNRSDRYVRNRVRHEVMPLLASLDFGSVAAIARGATHAAEDEALLQELSDGLGLWTTEASTEGVTWTALAQSVAEGPAPLVRRSLLTRLPEARSEHLDAIVLAARKGRGEVQGAGGWTARVVGDRIVLRILGRGAPPSPGQGA